MYKLLSTEDNAKLFFAMEGEQAERHGAIGYLRADFGISGREFWSTWFDTQAHLKNSSFKSELDAVINSMRDDGPEPPFANRSSLEAFCAAKPGTFLLGRGEGYMVRTLDFSYYFRCFPQMGDYDIYVHAYDNRFLLPELAGKHDLPDRCYTLLPSSGGLIIITAYESGYVPSKTSKPNIEANRLTADTSNKFFGITRAQEKAMLAGSMFGWDTPVSKPWNYSQDGKPLPMQKKKIEPER